MRTRWHVYYRQDDTSLPQPAPIAENGELPSTARVGSPTPAEKDILVSWEC